MSLGAIIAIAVIALVIVILVVWVISTYNKFVTMRNNVPSIHYKLNDTTYEGIAKYYNNDYDKIVYSNMGLQQKTNILLNIDKTRYTKFIRFNNRGINRKAKGTFIFRNYDDYVKHLEG